MFAGKRGRQWTMLARWLVPAMMLLAYVFMAATAETDTSGQAWMGLGFVFVMVLWWIFRLTTSSAALARAVGVGDADRMLEIVRRELPGRTRGRAKLLAARAFAYEVRGAWADTLTSADEARAAADAELVGPLLGTYRAKLAAARVAALVETKRVGEARAAYDAELAPADIAHGGALVQRQRIELAGVVHLAAGRVALAEGDAAAAMAELQRVLDDVRAGAFQRAGAHYYAARICDARGDSAGAASHRTEVGQLAPASWLAR
jgi:hypothetical protein|nr:hypothetical protein [Kofleriaceae bacterium]